MVKQLYKLILANKVDFYCNMQHWRYEIPLLDSEDLGSYKLQKLEGQDFAKSKSP